MPDDLVVTEPQELTAPEPPAIHLIARNPQQMAAAQSDMASWLQSKRDSLLLDIKEMESARDEARRHKWKTSSFASAISKFRRQHDYYQKVLEAVLAGYTLIPAFPLDIFAIRVTRSHPSGGEQYGGPHKADYLAEQPDTAAQGEGDYVSPKPVGYHTNRGVVENGKMVNKYYFIPTGFQSAEFPFAVARPEIMTATAEAMALRIFDQIGICTPASGQGRRRGKGDPLIIGQVLLGAERYGWLKKPVSFLIAWHLDLRTL